MNRATLAEIFAALFFAALFLGGASPAQAQKSAQHSAQQSEPVLLQVDATKAPIGLLHAHLVFPVSAGPTEISYTKWVPGEHAPTGPLNQIIRLVFSANDKQLPWTRDALEPFLFHLNVPSGSSHLEADLDFACEIEGSGFTPAICSSQHELILNWNLIALESTAITSDQEMVRASLKLPAGWRYGTPLEVEKTEGDELQFKPVSIKTLIDSPVLAGQYFETFPLGGDHTAQLDVIADSADALKITPEQKNEFVRLVAEATTLFNGARYDRYHLLITLGDETDHYTVEHFRASDNRLNETGFIDPRVMATSGALIPHEYIHSWNGKYRPPVHLDNPSYLDPVDGTLLWVYEGLTDYYGNVLAARSGLWTEDQFRENLAIDAAQMSTHPGRTWRSLQDITTGAQLLFNAPTAWSAARRATDFYPEGGLMWLEADMIIRERSKGEKSLDDFCHTFFAAVNGQRPKPYTFEDVVAGMNAVQSYDWAAFFRSHLDSTNPEAPLDGIHKSGWKLAYQSEKPELIEYLQETRKTDLLWPLWEKSDFTDLRYSIGLLVNDDGTVMDSAPGMAGYNADVVPGMKIIAVNGRDFSIPVIESAVAETKNGSPLEFQLLNGEFTLTAKLNYHGGAKYPILERESGQPDVLTQIAAPHSNARR